MTSALVAAQVAGLPVEWWDGLGQTFRETAYSGNLLLAVPVALLAGLVSFASPCVLPLLPGYLAYLGSMAGTDLAAGGTATSARRAEPRVRRRLLLGVGLFVLGFAVVFVAYGALAGSLGGLLRDHGDVVSRVLGVVVIVMGLAFTGLIPFLQVDARTHVRPNAGLWGAPLLGLTFAIGWAPCIGPTLTAILALSLDDGSAGRGALLSVAFCAGLGIPFLLAALGLGRSSRLLEWLRRNRRAVMLAGGGLLVLLGLALVTGVWNSWAQWLQGLLTGTDPFIPVI